MSQTTMLAAAQSAISPASNDVVDDLASKLAGAYAILDLIFILAHTGDLESLCHGTLSSSLGEAMTRIDDARDLLTALPKTERGAA